MDETKVQCMTKGLERMSSGLTYCYIDKTYVITD